MTKLKKPTQHEINRIIVGNQLMIMRLIANMAELPHTKELVKHKVVTCKQWWMDHYNEEVGFMTGDELTKPFKERYKG